MRKWSRCNKALSSIFWVVKKDSILCTWWERNGAFKCILLPSLSNMFHVFLSPLTIQWIKDWFIGCLRRTNDLFTDVFLKLPSTVIYGIVCVPRYVQNFRIWILNTSMNISFEIWLTWTEHINETCCRFFLNSHNREIKKTLFVFPHI